MEATTRVLLLLLGCGLSLFQWTEAREHSPSEAPDKYVFTCEVLPQSTSVPTSVHELRPGDIKVVGAMGDSMTAGTGITATNILEELIQNRGMSWSGGGQGTFEKYLTMPNILKKYNKRLYGFATADGDEKNVHAHFNVAVIGSHSDDLANQARMLVDRMKSDPNVDFVNDWKVVTILTGNNDLCEYCKKPSKYNEGQFYENLVRGLDVLHGELPRTLVNLVEPLNMHVVTELNQGVFCSSLHYITCECAAFPKTIKDAKRLRQLTAQYQKTVQELSMSGRYDTRHDFTVVHQPFFSNTFLPHKSKKHPDMSYFAPDCFHMSAKGQAAAAVALWNNMITPLPDKATRLVLDAKLKCASEDQPYIYTNRNSKPPPTAAPATDKDAAISHFSEQLLLIIVVCGGAVIVVGGILFIVISRRYRRRELYVQIPPDATD